MFITLGNYQHFYSNGCLLFEIMGKFLASRLVPIINQLKHPAKRKIKIIVLLPQRPEEHNWWSWASHRLMTQIEFHVSYKVVYAS